MGREPNLETLEGRYISLINPTADEIHLDDIACSLSKECRFGGFVPRHYSVAEHACLVSELIERYSEKPHLAFPALHHDSPEAYLRDIPKPLKELLGEKYEELTAAFDRAIGERFGIDPADFHDPVLKFWDDYAMRLEARELKHSRGVGHHWGHDEPVWGLLGRSLGFRDCFAEQEFRHRHNELAAGK